MTELERPQCCTTLTSIICFTPETRKDKCKGCPHPFDQFFKGLVDPEKNALWQDQLKESKANKSL